jgi:hypothetical protein
MLNVADYRVIFSLANSFMLKLEKLFLIIKGGT